MFFFSDAVCIGNWSSGQDVADISSINPECKGKNVFSYRESTLCSQLLHVAPTVSLDENSYKQSVACL